MISMYFMGMTALVAPRIREASGGWKRTSAPTFCSRSAMSPRVPLASPTRIMTMATSIATARTDTAVRVLRCITFAAGRLAMFEPDTLTARPSGRQGGGQPLAVVLYDRKVRHDRHLAAVPSQEDLHPRSPPAPRRVQVRLGADEPASPRPRPPHPHAALQPGL